MAINGKLTNLAGLTEVVEEGENIIENIQTRIVEISGNEFSITSIINRLNSYIQATEQEEAYILDKFQVSSEKELQQKFLNFYHKSGLDIFQGYSLEGLILQTYRTHLDEITEERQKKIEKILIPKMMEISGKKLLQIGEEEGGELLNQALNELSGRTGSHKVRSTRGAKNIEGILTIIQKDLTTVQQSILDNLDLNAKVSSSINGNNVQIITTFNTFDWFKITGGGKKASEVKENKELIEKANKEITNFILSKINNKYRQFASQAIKIMLDTEPTMFFVGKNVSDITGILGEISAMIAINALLPNASLNKISNWVATNKVDGQSLSIDILFTDMLKAIAGIQVKNSSKNLDVLNELDISFIKDVNVDTILKRLQNSYDIEFTKLEDVLVSKTFNVPYRMIGKRYVKTDTDFNYPPNKGSNFLQWDDFKNVYNKLQSLINRIELIFSYFSPDFLFMSGGKEFVNQLANLDFNMGLTGNNLYLIAGKPIFMSTMLNEIIEDLKEVKSDLELKSSRFNVDSSLGTILIGKQKVETNIVAYKNSTESGQKKIEKKNAKMKSSYKFDIS